MIAQDVITAAAQLADRAGAKSLEIGYTIDSPRPNWHASVLYDGARLSVEGHKTPTGAALELAERLLAGAHCRCGETVTIDDNVAGCRWRLVGPRWEPGCNSPAIHLGPAGRRGDLEALRSAYKTQTGKDPAK